MKIPNILFVIIAVTISIALISCEKAASTHTANSAAANPWDDLPELQINLPAKSAPENIADKNTPPEPDENGMITISIGVPPTFLYSGGYGDKPGPEITNARRILERAGVSFPEGADAHYDAITGLLNVHNTPEQIELVEAYTQPLGPGPEQQLTCRFEVFEIPSAFARELTERADKMPKHQGIRDQVIEACRQGSAEFITSVDLPCRSGQRTKTETGTQTLVAVPTGSPAAAETEEEPKPLLEWKQCGVQVEVDPVLGADGLTIDMNIAFTQAIHPDKNSASTTSEPPSVELMSNFTVIDRTTQLLGIFPAQETTVSETKSRQRMVFVQATVQFLE